MASDKLTAQQKSAVGRLPASVRVFLNVYAKGSELIKHAGGVLVPYRRIDPQTGCSSIMHTSSDSLLRDDVLACYLGVGSHVAWTVLRHRAVTEFYKTPTAAILDSLRVEYVARQRSVKEALDTYVSVANWAANLAADDVED